MWTPAMHILKSLLTLTGNFVFLPSLEDWNLLVSWTAYIPLMFLGCTHVHFYQSKEVCKVTSVL